MPQETPHKALPREHRRRLVGLACPVYGELLAGVVAGIVNMVWVARLGGPAVAAVAVATNVENLALGLILMAGSGTTVLVARARGARDPAALRTAVRGGWALCALLTPPVAVGGWALREPLARLVLGGDGGGAGGAALRLAADYFAVSLPGLAVFFAQNLLDGVLKGAGDTRTPMRLALLANALILVLDPLLVFGLCGLPGLGVTGAAWATVAGRSAALAAGLVALRRNGLGCDRDRRRDARHGRSRRCRNALVAPLRGPSGALRSTAPDAAPSPDPYRTPGRNGLLRKAAAARPAGRLLTALRATAATGLPMAADFTARMAGSLLLVAVVARIGVASVAAYAIATKAMYVATMSFYAVRQAAAIHTAHTLGAGRDARAAIARQAALLGAALGALAALVLLAAAPWVMRAFGARPDVAAAGTAFLRCLGPYLALLGCFIALGGVFEGAGGSPLMLRVTLAGTAVQLPLAHGLSGFGLPGVCAAMALAAALQCLAVLALSRRFTPPRAPTRRAAERAGVR
ncbi:MATE family efflux transporter [Streptomyces sp. ME19-01-6]|uniref:MATE family efflux transporter n=1 Tax=Streptomyces sp. ME19-01-6 TaxID=3028686 RepID=UPI0029B529C8|nr:MATE family efflux transporter [Streptomyces sp. ME19-01-6]MDX3232044.1 MATE family efflux transporter [Streptomyces sp. ME19-01-6]